MARIVSEAEDEKSDKNDLGSWLIAMGAPASITSMMPSEITGLDIAPLASMLGGVGIKGGMRGVEVEKKSADEIRWLPIIRC